MAFQHLCFVTTAAFLSPAISRIRASPLPTCKRRRLRCVACNQTPDEDTAPPTGRGDGEEHPKVSADWRYFRAKLVESETAASPTSSTFSDGSADRTASADGDTLWAHRVSHVEQGCLLVARPDYFAPDPTAYFAKSVVFVLSHGDHGTLGLILNKPIAASLASIPSDTSTPLGEAFHLAKAEFFCSSPLFNGGPMGLDSLMVLHSYDSSPEALKIIDGIYSGGLLEAISAVRNGELQASSVRFFAGYSGWTSGQLDQEIEEGTWYAVASSLKYVTGFSHDPTKDSPMWHELLRRLDVAPTG